MSRNYTAGIRLRLRAGDQKQIGQLLADLTLRRFGTDRRLARLAKYVTSTTNQPRNGRAPACIRMPEVNRDKAGRVTLATLWGGRAGL